MNNMPAVVRPEGQPPLVAQGAIVFGNTVRLSIIRALRNGPARRREIVERTGLGVDTLSNQLRELQDLGVIHAAVIAGRGRPMIYSLNEARLQELYSALGAYALGAYALGETSA